MFVVYSYGYEEDFCEGSFDTQAEANALAEFIRDDQKIPVIVTEEKE